MTGIVKGQRRDVQKKKTHVSLFLSIVPSLILMSTFFKGGADNYVNLPFFELQLINVDSFI